MKAEEFVRLVNENIAKDRQKLAEEGLSEESINSLAYFTKKLPEEKRNDITIPDQPELTKLLREYDISNTLSAGLDLWIIPDDMKEEDWYPKDMPYPQIGSDEEERNIMVVLPSGEIAFVSSNDGSVVELLAKDGDALMNVLVFISSILMDKGAKKITRKDMEKMVELAGGKKYESYYYDFYAHSDEYDGE